MCLQTKYIKKPKDNRLLEEYYRYLDEKISYKFETIELLPTTLEDVEDILSNIIGDLECHCINVKSVGV